MKSSEDHQLLPLLGEGGLAQQLSPRMDAARVLSLTIALVTLLPANLIVEGMTEYSRPGLVAGVAMFCWWILVRFSPGLMDHGPQPLRWAFIVFFASALSSYAIGFIRGLTSMEANGADSAMLFYAVFAGVALVAADGLSSWLRLRRVLAVAVGCAAIMGMIAIIQYVGRIDLAKLMAIPGLVEKSEPPGFEVRGDGIRVASTTTHYIELAALLAVVLPFAIHLARFGSARSRQLAGIATVLIASGIAVTISRTGVLAVGLMLLVLMLVWSWRVRFNALVLSVGLFAGLAVASPGLARTLARLFEDPSSSPAFTVRQDRYPMAFDYIAQRPWFGRGTGTWVFPQYPILDNQWLDTLITNGVIGTAALAGLHLTGIVLACLALRRSATEEGRHLCAALASTQVIGLVVSGTFDSLSFLTYATVAALMLGLCGAAWRLSLVPARLEIPDGTAWNGTAWNGTA